MTRFGTYKILEKERLIVEYHAGDIQVDDFIHSRKIISADPKYDPDYDLIMDYRNVNMIVDQRDIEKFIAFFKTFPSIIGKRKSAYLTSRPNEVVITTLFSMRIKDAPVQPRTFSTPEAVVAWMDKRDFSSKILREIIKELKTLPSTLYSSMR